MRITLKTNMASPEHGNASAGEIVDLPSDVARHLIETHQAYPANEDPAVLIEQRAKPVRRGRRTTRKAAEDADA